MRQKTLKWQRTSMRQETKKRQNIFKQDLNEATISDGQKNIIKGKENPQHTQSSKVNLNADVPEWEPKGTKNVIQKTPKWRK